jgi:hypothetical protein
VRLEREFVVELLGARADTYLKPERLYAPVPLLRKRTRISM